jgi:hypothetical protein
MFKRIFKNWFSKKENPDLVESVTVSVPKQDSCFICGEGEEEFKLMWAALEHWVALEYGEHCHYFKSVCYHRECVEHLICNTDKLPEEAFDDLQQAVQIVQLRKKAEIKDKEKRIAFERDLLDSKEFLCGEG